MSKIVLTISTCPDEDVARKIATALVKERLAACVNIIPGALSVYEWRGEIEEDQEVVLLVKAARERCAELQERIVALHPYELPEVISVSVTDGLAGYIDWVHQCTSSES